MKFSEALLIPPCPQKLEDCLYDTYYDLPHNISKATANYDTHIEKYKDRKDVVDFYTALQGHSIFEEGDWSVKAQIESIKTNVGLILVFKRDHKTGFGICSIGVSRE